MVHLEEPKGHAHEDLLEKYKDDLSFLGPMIEQEKAYQIAMCEIDPMTFEKYSETVERNKEKQ